MKRIALLSRLSTPFLLACALSDDWLTAIVYSRPVERVYEVLGGAC